MLSRKAPRITVRYSSAAAQAVTDSNDLLREILLRLPIRSLVQFKCVSKQWLSLISDPGFCHRRSTFHPPTPSGIFLRSCPHSPVFDFVDLRPNPPRVPIESLEFSVPKHGIVIQQSCNGLLLCCNEGQSHQRSDYYVYNPTTKQIRTLPKIQTEEDSTIAGLSLAFDPLRSSNYKVVCVRVLDSNNYQIEIYSSGSDADLWKPSGGRFPPPHNTLFDFGIYWNGGVHWPRKWENCVYLDLCDKKLHELPMPGAHDDWEGRRVEYFGNCGGHLHYIESSGRQAVLNVFEMENDRGGWFEKYRVDLHTVSHLFSKIISPPPLELSKFTVLAIVDQSEVDEDPYVVLQGTGKLAVRLNVKTGSFEKLVYILNGGGTTIFPMGFRLIDAFLYIESLACV